MQRFLCTAMRRDKTLSVATTQSVERDEFGTYLLAKATSHRCLFLKNRTLLVRPV